jgi:hypothetical protein
VLFKVDGPQEECSVQRLSLRKLSIVSIPLAKKGLRVTHQPLDKICYCHAIDGAGLGSLSQLGEEGLVGSLQADHRANSACDSD